jgi:hypothetical protein
MVGHQEQGIAGRRILDPRQRCGREPLVQPGAGDPNSNRSRGSSLWRFNPAEPASTCRACASTAASASLEKG